MGKRLKAIDSVKKNKVAKMLKREINKSRGCKVKKTHRK